MRTKALICAAAMAVASLAHTQAQVYSVNVAGYVTLSLTNGQSLISNPLDFDGNGTNNTLANVFTTNLPNLSQVNVYWAPTAAFSNCTYTSSNHKWSGGTNAANFNLANGKGLFVKINAAGVTRTNVTFVGNVRQGVLSNSFQITGKQVVSSIVPQGGLVNTDLGLASANLDQVIQWNTPAQKYFNVNTYTTSKHTWSLGEPVISVGEAFFMTTHAATKWSRNFTVQ